MAKHDKPELDAEIREKMAELNELLRERGDRAGDLTISVRDGILSVSKGEHQFTAQDFNVTREDDDIEIVLDDWGSITIDSAGRRC